MECVKDGVQKGVENPRRERKLISATGSNGGWALHK